MSFATPLFLWYFLPAVLLTHWLLPQRWRNGVIAVYSLAFYAVGGKEFVLVLMAMMALNYGAGRLIGAAREREGAGGLDPSTGSGRRKLDRRGGQADQRSDSLDRRGEGPGTSLVEPFDGAQEPPVETPQRGPSAKAVLAAAIVANLTVLGIWKYLGFFSEAVDSFGRALGLSGSPIIEIGLPIGISFFTFHHISYIVDVYRGERTPMRNPLTFATYIAMFPQLVAGPIVRYHEIADQLRDQHHDRFADFVDGFPPFIWGLAKKVLIADSLAPVADTAFAVEDPTFTTAWIGAIAYTGQIYFDFSGYSDMAIGLGIMLGLRLPQNFRRPYSATSITDFWRRWHMSLSRWFRDYLYIPLGGNRLGGLLTYRNLIIVFLLTGLWHGAAWTFVLWGVYHGTWLIIERATGYAKADRFAGLRRAATFAIVIFGWVLFRAADLTEWREMTSAMLSPLTATGVPLLGVDPDLAILIGPWELALLALVIASALIPGTWVTGRIIDGLDSAGQNPVRTRLVVRAAAYALAPYVAIVAVAGTFSPFLYFQF